MSAQAGSGSEERVLSAEETRRFYDRFGAKQDRQFYEAAPIEHMLAHGDFGHAASVFELGCGTGRLAERLLRERLHPHARYLGVDLSPTMVGLATRRLAPWRERAAVQLSEGSPSSPLPAGGCDRFVVTYVLDLLSDTVIREVLREARRVLDARGLLCAVSLTEGTSPGSRLLAATWRRIYKWRPALLGGCRPIRLAEVLDDSQWRTEHRSVVCSWGLCSEVAICSPRR